MERCFWFIYPVAEFWWSTVAQVSSSQHFQPHYDIFFGLYDFLVFHFLHTYFELKHCAIEKREKSLQTLIIATKLVGKLSPDPDSNDEELEHMQFVQMMTDMDIS